MRKLKIAKVYWRDATHYHSTDDISWFEKKAHTSNIVIVGRIIRAGRKEIVIAHEIDEDDKARDVSVIPRENISKIEYLVEKVNH